MVCRDLLYYPLPQLPPASTGLSILNPNFQDPHGVNSALRILIFIDGQSYDFSQFYNPPTWEYDDYRGFERGQFSFQITDWHPDFYNLPFTPVVDQYVECWNFNFTERYCSGYITNITDKLIVRRDDGTEVLVFTVEASDKKLDFERVYVNERYQNVKTGFVVKDIIHRFTPFDASTIDPTVGRNLFDFRVSREYPAQVIQRLLDLEGDWSFFVDPDTDKCYFGEFVDIFDQNPIPVDEDPLSPNFVYALFDAPTFSLSLDRSLVHNRIYFDFNLLYNTGTVSITKGDNVLFGQNTEWLNNIQPGAEVRIANTSSSYTVERVETNNQLRLNSPFQEPTISILSGVPYNISGKVLTIVVEDPVSIAQMAELRGETTATWSYPGVFEYQVPSDGTAYTWEEAEQIARAHLIRFVKPLPKGKASTYNTKLNVKNLRAGQIIYFQLPVGRHITANIVIQHVHYQDTGAIVDRREWGDPNDLRIDPLLVIELDFQDRMFDIRNQVKRLMADVRRGIVADTTEIRNVKIFSETIFFDDCVELVEPLVGPNAPQTLLFQDAYNLTLPWTLTTDELQFSDTTSLITPPAGPFYTLPTPRTPGYCVGATGFASCG